MSQNTTQPTGKKPNVLWIFGDQHRAQALGHNGDPNVNTPNLDRFSVRGLNFTNAFAGCPLCCPARGTLLTGLYPHLAVRGHQKQLPPAIPTVAHAFREAGYDTAYFGKWHLDGAQESEQRTAFHIIPPERRGGFETWVAYENNNSSSDCWVHGGEGEGKFHYRLKGFETDALTDLFIDDFRKRAQGDRPFFSVLSVIPPHDPYTAPEEWMRRHNPAGVQLRPNVPPVSRIVTQAQRDLAGYYAMIENLDWNFGRIMTALEEAGLIEDTIVMFFSDHGDSHGSHGLFRKCNPYEESVRVPLIIGQGRNHYDHRWGHSPMLASLVDVAPTSLGLCGIEVPKAMLGTDLSWAFRHDRPRGSAPDSVFLQFVEPVFYGKTTDRPWRGIVTNDGWKYVVLEGQPWLLFNLNEDPYEMANLAHDLDFAAKRRQLQERLAQWIRDTGDSFPLPVLPQEATYHGDPV